MALISMTEDINDLVEYSFSHNDEDEEIMDWMILISRKPYTIRERPNFFNIYDENEFLTRFRLQKLTVLKLLHEIEDALRTRTERNKAVEPLNQLLLTLRFYATGSFLITIGDFGGIHKSTMCRIIKKVTVVLASLCPQYIKFPESNTEKIHVKKQFYRFAKFPKVIGAIDCTHIKIESPVVGFCNS
ncbi:putative nuclease HARBI1 [Prorops nasuta]|uniref:putative nuclease HARBI1 n=1 Tax=Prorops nasuta TaxID=863751 RepID=UPI0034CF051E